MDFTAMPLDRAVQMLALATDASVSGLNSVATPMRPVTLKWQGRNAVEAWHVLLAADMSYAAHCTGTRCNVWLAGVLSASTVTSSNAPMRLPTPAATRPAPESAPTAKRLTASDEAAAEIAAFGEPQ